MLTRATILKANPTNPGNHFKIEKKKYHNTGAITIMLEVNNAQDNISITVSFSEHNVKKKDSVYRLFI